MLGLAFDASPFGRGPLHGCTPHAASSSVSAKVHDRCVALRHRPTRAVSALTHRAFEANYGAIATAKAWDGSRCVGGLETASSGRGVRPGTVTPPGSHTSSTRMPVRRTRVDSGCLPSTLEGARLSIATSAVPAMVHRSFEALVLLSVRCPHASSMMERFSR